MCSNPPHAGSAPLQALGWGSLPPPGAQGGSSGGISPSLAPATVLFPLQVQSLILTTCTSTSWNLQLSDAVLQHDLLAHSLASRGKDLAFRHSSISLKTSVPQSRAQAPPCWLLPRPQILGTWADHSRDTDSPSSGRAPGQASSPESLEPAGEGVTSSGGKSRLSPCRGSASWAHKTGVFTAALLVSRAQSPNPREQVSSLLCPFALRPVTQHLSPEQSWITTNPGRIRGTPSAERVISLAGYTDCSWPSAPGYALQDS